MMCPVCGAEQRVGVWLPRKKVPIFDRIWQAGDYGISGRRLAGLFETNLDNIKSHIYAINAILEETDYVIRGQPCLHDSRFRILKREVSS